MTGAVVWLTGPPASGKSTLAAHLAARMGERGASALILDGDQVRDALVPGHGFDDAGRDAFYRTLGNLACLVARQGLITIVAATAHRRVWRDRVRSAAPRFLEVHVATPLDECRRRDPKGLYASHSASLPGSGVPYEPPLAPDVVAPWGNDDAAIEAVIACLDR